MPCNSQHSISFGVTGNNYKVSLYFCPIDSYTHVEYFGKHLSLCSLPLGEFPAYAPFTILFILLYKMAA